MPVPFAPSQLLPGRPPRRKFRSDEADFPDYSDRPSRRDSTSHQGRDFLGTAARACSGSPNGSLLKNNKKKSGSGQRSGSPNGTILSNPENPLHPYETSVSVAGPRAVLATDAAGASNQCDRSSVRRLMTSRIRLAASSSWPRVGR